MLGSMRWPNSAWRLLTQTSPAEINTSAARREHTPASARNFCKRIGPASRIVDEIGVKVLRKASPRAKM